MSRFVMGAFAPALDDLGLDDIERLNVLNLWKSQGRAGAGPCSDCGKHSHRYGAGASRMRCLRCYAIRNSRTARAHLRTLAKAEA